MQTQNGSSMDMKTYFSSGELKSYTENYIEYGNEQF